jgi:glycosyltransferase involved in cell wall biosynthesis
MKVLISSSTLDVKNGYGNITYEYVSALKKAGHDITLLLPASDAFYQYDIPGVAIERILPKYIFNYKSRASIKHLLWKYNTRQKFDIVHSLLDFPYAPLMCREARRMKVPFVVGAQGTYGVQPLYQFPERLAMKYTYSHANAIVVPSEYTKNAILKGAGQKYNISIVHNGVNYQRFSEHKVSNLKLQNLLSGKKVLLTVGALKSRKGQDLVIKALPDIVKAHQDVMYVMVGSPTLKAEFELLAAELGVRDYIYVAGKVSDEEILDYFHLCDIYVHTPKVHNRFQFEGFGIVYLEAGAAGKTSVATDAGGVRDAVLHGKTGLIADNENIAQISESIIHLLSDSDLRNIYSKNARVYAEGHRWSVIVKEFENIYLTVLKN